MLFFSNKKKNKELKRYLISRHSTIDPWEWFSSQSLQTLVCHSEAKTKIIESLDTTPLHYTKEKLKTMSRL